MATCKNCGKPLIPYGGKCVYCGMDINNAQDSNNAKVSHPHLRKVDDPRPEVVADFVFCLDCLGSMLIVLDSIKDNIAKLMEELDTMEDELFRLDWNARVMGYRNFEVDEEYLMNYNPFVSSVEDFKRQLVGMEAKGCAENEPCSTLDAIWYAAKKSEWRKWCQKFVIVFTDAPSMPINEKTYVDITDAQTLAKSLYEDHVILLLWGKEDPLYDELKIIPRAVINQFKDPIEFYYHKTIEFEIRDIIHHLGVVERYADYLYSLSHENLL